MKSKLFVVAALVLFLGGAVYAQTTPTTQPGTQVNVPTNVQGSFSKNYSTVKNPTWTTDKTGNYVASFNDASNSANQAYFDRQGTWIGTQTVVSTNQIPAASRQYITDNYSDATDIQYGTYKTANGTYYMATIDPKGTNPTMVYFDKTGKMVDNPINTRGTTGSKTNNSGSGSNQSTDKPE